LVMQSLQYVFSQHGVFIGSMNIFLSTGHSKPRSRTSLSSSAVAFCAAGFALALAWNCSQDALSGSAITNSPSALTMTPEGALASSPSAFWPRAVALSTVLRNDRGMPVVLLTRGRLSYSGLSLVGQS